MRPLSVGVVEYLKKKKSEGFSLTWLESGADHAEYLLRVEQAICTNGVCKTLLIHVT